MSKKINEIKDEYTKDQLEFILTSCKIDYPSSSTKYDLVEILCKTYKFNKNDIKLLYDKIISRSKLIEEIKDNCTLAKLQSICDLFNIDYKSNDTKTYLATIICNSDKDLTIDKITRILEKYDFLNNFKVTELRQLCLNYNGTVCGNKNKVINKIIDSSDFSIEDCKLLIKKWEGYKYYVNCFTCTNPYDNNKLKNPVYCINNSSLNKCTICGKKELVSICENFFEKCNISLITDTTLDITEPVTEIEEISTTNDNKIIIKKRSVSEALKKQIAGKQKYKCANKPNSNLKNLEDYICPFWNKQDDSGCFDESGYEIDHIEEHCINGNDSPENLQALCKCCHIVKTKRFMMSCSK